MRIILVRHAIAARVGKPAPCDEDRQLTHRGAHRMEVIAKALRDIAPRPRAVLTSPLVRARQTAELIARAWGDLEFTEGAALVDGDWDGICRLLDRYRRGDTVALVGHEPWISRLTARLLGGKAGRAFPFRKGGVAMIEIEQPRLGHGTLAWFIPPRVFRKLVVRRRI